MLICKFASPRSNPERITNWISYLEDMMKVHDDDAESALLLERLLEEARVWGVPQESAA